MIIDRAMKGKLYLRPFEDNDMELFKEWLNRPHISRWYHEPQDWIYEVTTRKAESSFIKHFIACYDNKPVGFCQYYEYIKGGEDWHGSLDIGGLYSIDYLIGEPELLGKGIGRQMINKLLELIGQVSGVKAVIVQPETENKSSCAVLLSCGFVLDEDNKLFFREIN